MLQKLTGVTVVDNTAVTRAVVIQQYSGRKKYSVFGDLVRITTRAIQRQRQTKKVRSFRKRRIIFRKRRRMSTIIRTRRAANYIDGSLLFFYENGVILYKKRKVLRGKRFFGITTRCVGFEKLIQKFKIHI